ncbi:hypothetical protein B0H14DRAFT_961162 [Mycena olivaceomarginata]|nr:hypothetical protein B0H14DRAFT_961162 [Mycena olivaceomarginata]
MRTPNNLLRLHRGFAACSPISSLSVFINNAASLNSLPYQWETMMTLVTPNLDLADPLMDYIETPLELTLYGHLVKPDLTKDHMATIICAFVSLWRPETATCIHGAIIHYIMSQTDGVLTDLLRKTPIAMYFWKCLTHTLSTPLNGGSTFFPQTLDNIGAAVWRLLTPNQGFELPIGGDVLEALLQLPPSPLTTSVIALVKMNILQSSLFSQVLHPSILKPLMPTETAFDTLDEIPTEFPPKMIWHDGGGVETSRSEERQAFDEHILEAQLALTISFLEDCHQGCCLVSPMLPYKAKETLQYLRCPPLRMIHNSYKIRFAQVMHDLFRDNSWDLLKVLVQCEIFTVYYWGGTGSWTESPKWLDDPAARAQVTEALTGLLIQDSATTMVREILAGLKKLHGMS